MQRWLSLWPEVIWMPSWMNFNKERFHLKFTIETYAIFLLNLYPGPQLCSFPISYPSAYFFPCSFFSLWVSLFSHHLLKVLRSFWKLLLNKSNEEMENCCHTQVRKWLEILTESNKYTYVLPSLHIIPVNHSWLTSHLLLKSKHCGNKCPKMTWMYFHSFNFPIQMICMELVFQLPWW